MASAFGPATGGAGAASGAGAGSGAGSLGGAGSGPALEFLADGNICGQTLLRLVCRGSAIIAELQRLSQHIPSVMLPSEENPMAAKYAPVLFDFRYLKTPEMFDKQINTSAELGDVDDEFYASHEELLSRFYALFENVYRYIVDYNKYLGDLIEGFYIQHTLADVLLDTDGKQLMCEALYLLGVMLLTMDTKVPGPVRERLIVAHYRHKGESVTVPIVELAKLCRDTGFRPGEAASKRPVGYPEEYFRRFPIPKEVVSMVLARLRTDDVYHQLRVYPAPEHQSFALSQQASVLYVCLYFSPRTLTEEKKEMREIVDKHFSDNWVVSAPFPSPPLSLELELQFLFFLPPPLYLPRLPSSLIACFRWLVCLLSSAALQVPVYMGALADLTVEWDRYKAAREALQMDALKPETVRALIERHRGVLLEADRQLNTYLTEGVLTEDFVIDNLPAIMDTLRRTNTSLRWAMLHRRTEHRRFREMILAPSAFGPSPVLLDASLRTALLELRLKAHVRRLLRGKADKWAADRAETEGMLLELAEYFSGARALTRVEREEELMNYFNNLAAEVRRLDYADAVLAGRKIRQLIKGLEEVTAFDAVDASASIKEFLALARAALLEMVRTVNVTEVVEADIDTISDMSFAWELIRDYVADMHERIRGDPTSVAVLRALFLKLTSVLNTPLVRITQAASRDEESVAQFYSGELVAFLRRVLEVIPVIVFSTLEGVIRLQTQEMKPLPVRFEVAALRDLAQADARHDLARRTHQISVFTEGVLAMKKTLLGVIKVDPRQILNDGIRKHLVDQTSRALHSLLVFDTRLGRGRDPKSAIEGQLSTLRDVLGGFRKSFEYVQDYIGIYGLKMWQEEFTRIVRFNTEQEANKYLRRRILPDASIYQSSAIPVPLYLKPPAGDTSGAITFMGRLVDALLVLTHPARTVYGPGCLGGAWHDAAGREVAGLGLFNLLSGAVGVPGLGGVDRLLGFAAERELARTGKAYAAELKVGLGDALLKLAEELQPATALSPGMAKAFAALAKRSPVAKALDALLESLLNVGQAQLLRRAIAHELRFSCRLESNLLCGALEAVNESLLCDIRRHYATASASASASGSAGGDADGAATGGAGAGAGAAPVSAAHPLPGAGSDDALLPAVTDFCEAAGINEPLTKIYAPLEPQPLMGLWLALFVTNAVPRLAFDKEFGSLIRRKATDGIDGAPLVAGLVTLLKQVHPSVTHDWLCYTGQFIRSAVHVAVGGAGKATPVPPDAILLLLLVQHVARVARIPDRVVHAHIPPYLFETLGTL